MCWSLLRGKAALVRARSLLISRAILPTRRGAGSGAPGGRILGERANRRQRGENNACKEYLLRHLSAP